jgi:hypothetical protein
VPTLRRDFLKDIALAGALPALLASPKAVEAAAELLQQSKSQAPTFEFDRDTYNYWVNYMKPGVPARREPVGGGPRGQHLGLAPVAGVSLARQPVVLHYDDSKGFRTPDQIAPSELSPTDGDASVSYTVSGFKFAHEDRATFEKLQSGTLRVDMAQNDLDQITAAVDQSVWVSLAALLPTKDGKLPPLTKMNFDPNSSFPTPQTVTLPGGKGKLGISLGVQRKDSVFCQFMSILTTEVGRFAPVMGLPSVGLGALDSFNKLLGYIYTKPQWILRTLGLPVYATSDSWKAAGAGTTDGLPLRNASYVFVPHEQIESFQKQVNATPMVIRDNYIVAKSNQDMDIETAALKYFPDVTYATMAVKVKQGLMPCGGGNGSGGNRGASRGTTNKPKS